VIRKPANPSVSLSVKAAIVSVMTAVIRAVTRREKRGEGGKSSSLYTQAVYLPLAQPLITAPDTALIKDPWLKQLKVSVLVCDCSCCVHVTNRHNRHGIDSHWDFT
jgi:small neutral amino acid transporter SnatA (MarC family)